MIFHKKPLLLDAWIESCSEDEALLAFAVHEKIPLTMAISHPLHLDITSKTAACISKQFIQDRFLLFSGWMPQRSFSWSKVLSKLLLEIKSWLMPKELTPYQAISEMVWLNWLVIVHPQTAYLISIGENHTHLFRRREWRSFCEVPVDSSDSDFFLSPVEANQLPSLCLRQIALHPGDVLIMANDIGSIQTASGSNQKDVLTQQQNAKQTLNLIHQQFELLHLTNPNQSVGIVQVSPLSAKK